LHTVKNCRSYTQETTVYNSAASIYILFTLKALTVADILTVNDYYKSPLLEVAQTTLAVILTYRKFSVAVSNSGLCFSHGDETGFPNFYFTFQSIDCKVFIL